jgi:branched-chain amino acid transport system substrate-binding protein
MTIIRGMITSIVIGLVAVGVGLTLPSGVQGQSFKIGMSLGITGYMADGDQSKRDGAIMAIEKINREGGVLGRKIEYVVEDMRSEPQQAVTVVNKLIVSDKVNLIFAGSVSAGNAASAPVAARNKVPMIMASVLPPAEQVESIRWCFSTLPLPSFEITNRFGYLQKKTKIKKIGIIHDPTPYVARMKNNALSEAPKYGLTVVGSEQYKVDDSDMKAQLTKLVASGAEAILKFGTGPTTIVVAKNMRELGMTIPLLTSTSDMSDFWPSAEALGKQFFFVGYFPQVPEVLGQNDPIKKLLDPFLKLWTAKYGKRDSMGGAGAWDAIHLAVAAIKSAGSVDSEKVRSALEQLGNFVGTSAIYQFTNKEHAGVQINPLRLCQIINGKIQMVYDPTVEK